jgi:hypothetical protein
MTRLSYFAAVWIAVLLSAISLDGQQAFPVVSPVDASTIAGRPVALDASGKLLPWPMPNDTGYSYSAFFFRSGRSCGTSTTGSGFPTTIAASISIERHSS